MSDTPNQNDDETITFQCPSCGESSTLAKASLGKFMPCPSCGQSVAVHPRDQATPDSELHDASKDESEITESIISQEADADAPPTGPSTDSSTVIKPIEFDVTVFVAIALIAVGLIGLFPPRSKVVGDHLTHNRVSRGFLFTESSTLSGLDVYLTPATEGQRNSGFAKMAKRCRIDVGRLLCEVLVVGLVTGVAMLVTRQVLKFS